ncbi:MAG TPA: PIG-L deacetylase family protein [Methylomirabilota bacterium]|nr:PIG-L deacetylase family protein [Methylomirabilota bacterium]
MNVVVIAPHPDDESVGCGGAVCRHVGAGDRVVAVFLTSGELGLKSLKREEAWRIREGEARMAGKILGIEACVFLRLPDWEGGGDVAGAAERLGPVLREAAPELIYLPHVGEWHPDHRAALPVLRAAMDGGWGQTVTLRLYEVWTPLSHYDHVEDITSVMSRKLRAVRAHRSQLTEYAYDRAIRGLNAYRGILAARTRYAEVFQVMEAPFRQERVSSGK